MSSRIMGINVCNPVDVCKEYLLYTVDYARKAGLNHIQINGPIHDSVKGNIDGMTKLVKYADFNGGKDEEYIKKASDAVNTACDRAEEYGIKVYVWHHELELPRDFKKRFPQILNSYGDIELTHPLVRDFLDNKIGDFFAQYPKVSGIVLTLHETSVPILKLKEQKLEEKERVEYVTRIIFEACERLGKELIVRPFASIEKDYEIMAAAYGRISEKLSVMDKWTQFDWSLTAPDNPFFSKITKNPLLVEADIFGEFFGRNYFPMMLKKHIEKKVEYCEKFAPVGYVARIDRNGAQPFGDINEVNLVIMNSLLKGLNPDSEIDRFFNERFGAAAAQMRSMVPYADVMKLSDEETLLLTGAAEPEEAAHRLLAQGVSCVAVTLGERGALVAVAGGMQTVPAFSSDPVDTTGAGDGFWGGFLHRMLTLDKRPAALTVADAADCARWGNATAALCITRRGGIPAMPALGDVQALLLR